MAERKMTEANVLALFREEKITASRGAELLGMPLQDFINLLHANGLTLCDGSPEEVEEGLRNLEEVFKKHQKKAKVV